MFKRTNLSALLAAAILVSGCGGATVTVPGTETKTVTAASGPADTISVPAAPGAGSVPFMPNVDEAAAVAVTGLALKTYEGQWGDGSGVHAVWGPNIDSGWALIGVENISGAAGKDVLLHEESGVWQVKDIGHGLVAAWGDQTPASLWPNQ